MRLTTTQTDRALGVLLGQACGDALGVPYEFGTPPGPQGTAEMRGGGLGDYAPGEWSDDTQMATCIAEVAATGADLTTAEALDEIAEGFLRWRSHGPADIGVQTSAVLSAADRLQGRPSDRLAKAASDYTASHAHSAGNGALMRTSVVALASLDDPELTARAAREIAKLTHADPLAGDSCVIWSEAVRVAVVKGRFDLLGGLKLIPTKRQDAWATWLHDALNDEPGRFTPNGFTVTALQAAASAIVRTPTPDLQPARASYPCLHLQHALHAAVRIGDDTDTVAAIAGGLLGARWGASAVPAEWSRILHGWPGLRARGLTALAALTANGGHPDGAGWPSGTHVRYPGDRTPAIAHPLDEGVWLGTADCGGHDADAVVSLCRLGTAQVPAVGAEPRNHIEVRLIDSDDPDDNPNLHFVLADTAATIQRLRDEGRTVLVHCVAAQQRTPSVAAAYARVLGASADEAHRVVRAALPNARGSGRLWDAAVEITPEALASR
ncbi:MAG: ADP-ribosylglycohydrolase family protein [Nocardioidaceae bacterium]|nr:ADP-ribosylglycohydrolase family protein [Nocardioidaceae bacterium]